MSEIPMARSKSVTPSNPVCKVFTVQKVLDYLDIFIRRDWGIHTMSTPNLLYNFLLLHGGWKCFCSFRKWVKSEENFNYFNIKPYLVTHHWKVPLIGNVMTRRNSLYNYDTPCRNDDRLPLLTGPTLTLINCTFTLLPLRTLILKNLKLLTEPDYVAVMPCWNRWRYNKDYWSSKNYLIVACYR